MPSQGDIVLIPVPFTDLSSTKRRPVIVVSRNSYHQSTSDMLVVAMTSNPTSVAYSFTITNADMIVGQLNRAGQVRVDKIYTLSQALAVRQFGRVSPAIIQRIRDFFQDLTDMR